MSTGRTRSTIASGHPVTTTAARTVLEGGGNAFDAVVAAAFASSVAEPMLTSMAGGGFCLVRTATGDAQLVDFFVDVPGTGDQAALDSALDRMVGIEVQFASTTQGFRVGWASVATPGCLDGWLHLHRTRGSLPLADVLAPAVSAATDGVEVNDQQAYLFRILSPTNRTDAATAARFVPDGAPLATGATFRQPDVADFLRALGADEASTVAHLRRELAIASAASGGVVNHQDLSRHEVIEREPMRAEYRGATVLTNPAPSLGGRLVAAQLAALAEGPPLSGWDDPDGLRRIVDAQLAADRLRSPASTQGTTHISVADDEGNVATMTTSNGSGSGCTVPGTGILANNMLGEDDLFPSGPVGARPGTRVPSMMSPTLVVEDDRVVMALGSGGSKRIRTAVAQVVARSVDHEPELQRAVAGPRVHWDGERAQVEPGHPRLAVEALAGRVPVHEWDEIDLYFGGVHAVQPGVGAAGDPRRGGSAVVF